MDLDLPLEAVVMALLADGVLLCMRGVCLEDRALLVVEVASFVLPGSFLDLVPRSLLELLGFEVPMPGKGGKAQSWLINSGEGALWTTEGFGGFDGDRRLEPVLTGEAITDP